MKTNPASPLLHALVGDQELAACFSSAADLAAMLRFEVALAEAEAEAGLVEPAAAQAIATACATFAPDWQALADGLSQDGVVVPAFVKQLRAAVGASHERSVHVGVTSQDVIDTSLTLRLKDVTRILLQRIDDLIKDLNHLQTRDGTTPLMAHTRMQKALPFTVADKLETWTAPLQRHRERLLDLVPHLLVIQLGGPIGTRAELGTKADAVAAAVAARLDLHVAPSWHSQRDRIGEFGSFLSLVSGTLGKIGQDLALMAQNEVGAVRLRAGGGSSAMAHKSNPVGAEVLVALARFNAGLLGTLHQALVHENERSGAAWTLEWMVLPQMVNATAAGLQRAQTLVAGVRFVALK